MFEESRSGPERFFLNALRIVAGLLFWQHGAQKLLGWFGGNQVESVLSLMGVAGTLEFFGGILIAVGLLTRPVAFILAGEMASAYFLGHLSRAETLLEQVVPILNGGELAALYCFTFLYIVARGGGGFSLDGWMRRRREGHLGAGSSA